MPLHPRGQAGLKFTAMCRPKPKAISIANVAFDQFVSSLSKDIKDARWVLLLRL